jgi:hypothetical protein
MVSTGKQLKDDSCLHEALKHLRKLRSDGCDTCHSLLHILTALLWDLPKYYISKSRSRILDTSRRTWSNCRRKLQNEEVFYYSMFAGERCFVTDCVVCKPLPSYRHSDIYRCSHEGPPIPVADNETQPPDYSEESHAPPYIA